MITIRQLQNLSKGQSAMAMRHVMAAYEKIYKKIADRINILGADKQGSRCIVYLSIPSETRNDKIYTVAIQIESVDKIGLDTQLKVYSNSPAFLFNFVYVFNQKGALLFPDKYPNEFKNIAPKMRNSMSTVGFDKHLFSAIRFISDYKLKRILGTFDSKPVPQVPSIRLKVNRNTGKTELAD